MLEARNISNAQRRGLTASRVHRFAPEGGGALLLAVMVVDLVFGEAMPFVVYPLLAAGLATALVTRRGEKDRARLAGAGDALAATRAELALAQSEIERCVGERTRELEAHNAELTVLAQIAKTVNMSLDIQQVYLAFLTEARRLLPFDQASIAVYTPDRTTLRLMRVHDVDGALVGEQHEVDAATSIQASLVPSLIEDIESHGEFREREWLLRNNFVCGASVPIAARGVLLGSFNVVSNTRGAIRAEHATMMERMTEPLALALDNNRLYAEMREMAESDGLTGLPNRRSLLKHLHTEIARCGRYQSLCSVLVMDIDNFKVFNDTLGHQAGDELLVDFAKLLRSTCRDFDIVARQSGDEFTVLLPETGTEDAFTVGQRIHDALTASGWRYPGQGVPVSTSIGVATYPGDADDDEKLLNRADTAMYEAKAAGGGQTRLASSVVDDASASDGPRQVRFGVLETLANTVVSKLAETGSRMRTLASFTAQASIQIAEQLSMEEADQRILRVAALSHALGIFPTEDPEDWNVENPWGLDPELDATYLKLGRLFVVASPGLDQAVHAVHHHHRPLSALDPAADTRFTRILAVSEAYARRTMPGAEPQLSSREAIAVLRGDDTLDQTIVERLALAVRADSQNAA